MLAALFLFSSTLDIHNRDLMFSNFSDCAQDQKLTVALSLLQLLARQAHPGLHHAMCVVFAWCRPASPVAR
jgi:hypothetical protein